MTVKHVLYLSVLLASVALAEGPVFQHKDPVAQQEFENVYKDLRGASVSSGTYIQNRVTLQSGATFFVSSGTASAFTASNVTAGAVTATTVSASSVTVTARFLAPTGTVATPSYGFTSDTGFDTGLYRLGENSCGLVGSGSSSPTIAWVQSNAFVLQIAGTELYDFVATSFFPAVDNSISAGKTGFRWSAVWAANGTIQTSSSKLKKSIREIQVDDSTTTLVALTTTDISTITFNAADDPNDIQVPRGIVFKWRTPSSTATANADMIGFVGDDLPQEAHALKADGTRDPENFYTSAVVGIQSAAIRDLQRKNRRLLRRVRRLETMVSEIQAQLGIAVADPDPSAPIP